MNRTRASLRIPPKPYPRVPGVEQPDASRGRTGPCAWVTRHRCFACLAGYELRGMIFVQWRFMRNPTPAAQVAIVRNRTAE